MHTKRIDLMQAVVEAARLEEAARERIDQMPEHEYVSGEYERAARQYVAARTAKLDALAALDASPPVSMEEDAKAKARQALDHLYAQVEKSSDFMPDREAATRAVFGEGGTRRSARGEEVAMLAADVAHVVFGGDWATLSDRGRGPCVQVARHLLDLMDQARARNALLLSQAAGWIEMACDALDKKRPRFLEQIEALTSEVRAGGREAMTFNASGPVGGKPLGPQVQGEA